MIAGWIRVYLTREISLYYLKMQKLANGSKEFIDNNLMIFSSDFKSTD